ncbi:serine hydrolase domain-containing protein [Steroidobacter sp.]|uniref:serine hydrolase domain-containing protein n=1 Tax=Steroidobacter sp. TaxID=1978227 RepID=UPI001A61E746|nr:serine hydrolase domain-containing protein [Steroidobacter sp.]MBL8265378.1 beta-lactamase family protein [Steroidobacter sp.]
MKSLRQVAALCAVTAAICGPTTCRADAIDDYVNAAIEANHTPGLALAVVQDGVLVRAQGYGYANLEHRVPVHPDTIFQTGSLGKMFTAVAVMLMVEDGKLSLDESIRKYLPDAPASWQKITIRQLLTHTSGMGAAFYSHGTVSEGAFDLRQDYSDEQLLQFFYRAELVAPAGHKFSYSNTGYALLGVLVKRVGGRSYAEVLKQRVFGPLAMHTAGQIDDRGIVPNRAAGYQVREDGTVLNQQWVAPTSNSTGDGTLYLTVLDWAKWDAGVRARKILKPESWAQMLSPVRLNSGKTYPYGFGWYLFKVAGQKTYQHSGQWQGFVANYVRYEDAGLSVIVLTNSASGNASAIGRRVAQMIEPALVPPPAAAIEDRDPRVTQRLRQILLETEIPAKERAAFPSAFLLDRAVVPYQKHRSQLGRLQELRLFGFEELGDEAAYTYRASFDKGLLEVVFELSPSGAIPRLAVRPLSGWDEPLK